MTNQEALARLRGLGNTLNSGGHPPNLAEQIWDCCDALTAAVAAEKERDELRERLREVISLIDDPCPYDKATTLTIARQALAVHATVWSVPDPSGRSMPSGAPSWMYDCLPPKVEP